MSTSLNQLHFRNLDLWGSSSYSSEARIACHSFFQVFEATDKIFEDKETYVVSLDHDHQQAHLNLMSSALAALAADKRRLLSPDLSYHFASYPALAAVRLPHLFDRW